MTRKAPSLSNIATWFALALFLGITAFSFASLATSAEKLVVYKNSQYRFRFFLPPSWKGYSIVADEWIGGDPTQGSSTPTLHGPIITIRNPKWSEDEHGQDIPIMVFTLAEWERVEQETLVVSAAPFGPEEIGHNKDYVFALPPRYTNDASAQGVEEVLHMVHGGALHPY